MPPARLLPRRQKRAFLVKPDPASDFAEEFEFDVVVVGAGESGLSAVHSALAAGATVACLQNADAPFTTGNMSACVDLEQTSAAGQAAIASFINGRNAGTSFVRTQADKSPLRDLTAKKCAGLSAEYKLSERESQVFERMARGQTVPYIAAEMGISQNTVRMHSKHIYAKLDVHKRQDLFELLDER